MKRFSEFLFVENYKPQKIDDFILPTALKSTLTSFRDSGEIPNLILTGKPGTGKSSSILSIANEIGLNVYFINGSSEGRLLSTVRDGVTQFCSSMEVLGTNSSKKLVLFDEFDNTVSDVQLCLRGVIEEFQGYTSFVFTCNNYNKINDAIISRCVTIDFNYPESESSTLKNSCYSLLKQICNQQGIVYTKEDLVYIIKHYFPDFRRMLNELQRGKSLGNLSTLVKTIESKLDPLVDAIKNKDVVGIRTYIMNNSWTFNSLVTDFYKSIKKYIKPDYIPQAIIILNDYQYKHEFVADLEMNLVACMVELSIRCEFL